MSERISKGNMFEEFYVYGRDISEWDRRSSGLYTTNRWFVKKYIEDWIPANKMYELVEDNDIERPRDFVVSELRRLGYEVGPAQRLKTYGACTQLPDHFRLDPAEAPTAAWINCIAHGIGLGVVPHAREADTIRDWVEAPRGKPPKNPHAI